MSKVWRIFKVYEWIFLLLCVAAFISLGVIYHSPILELISVFLGLAAVSLNLKRKKYAFFVYSFYVLFYGIVSFIEKQYGEAILNIFYNLPVYLFTLYKYYIRDRKQGEEKSDFSIKQLSKKNLIIIICLIPVITIAYGFILKSINSALPFLNALSTSFALVACYLASKASLSQWIFWILYSACLVAIWTINYFSQDGTGLLYLVLNAVYIIINLYGLITWIITKERKNENSHN